VLGKFHSSSESLERAIALGEDNPAIVNNAIGYLAATLWSLGYPDRAATRMRRALDEKKGFDRPRLAANVLAYGGFLFLRMRLWQMSRQLAESGSMLANQHGLLFHASWFAIVHGRALIGCGERDEGIAEMRHGIAGMDALGAARPFLIGYLAEGCLEAGLHREGLEVVARAARRAEETGERWTWADLLRIRGELCLMQDSSKTAEAERDFRAAISLAEEQGAKSYELRAATSLARLLRQSRAQEARIILSRVVNWFTEGFDTADLQDAKVLLGELSC
jgi:predicted ATPase